MVGLSEGERQGCYRYGLHGNRASTSARGPAMLLFGYKLGDEGVLDGCSAAERRAMGKNLALVAGSFLGPSTRPRRSVVGSPLCWERRADRNRRPRADTGTYWRGTGSERIQGKRKKKDTRRCLAATVAALAFSLSVAQEIGLQCPYGFWELGTVGRKGSGERERTDRGRRGHVVLSQGSDSKSREQEAGRRKERGVRCEA